MVDEAGKSMANIVTQVTNTTAADFIAGGTIVVNLLTLSARHLSNDGSLLVFESSGDLVSGKNADKTRAKNVVLFIVVPPPVAAS